MATSLDYRNAPLPSPWPWAVTRNRARARFKENWGGTMKLLAAELKHLNAKDVVMHLDVQPNDIRIDGGVRANARIRNPAVVIAFKSGASRLSFPCDTFDFWQHNVRAVALALEALRAVDRYGVQQGKQYEGFKALPAATPTTSAAADLAELAGIAVSTEPTAEWVTYAGRLAKNRHHPNAGGSPEDWERVQKALDVLNEVIRD